MLNQAIGFAVEKHNGQFRKQKHIPYILHPMEVAVTVSSMTEQEETIAAAMLHDVAEDCGVTIHEIRDRFGERVAELVASETEDKRPEQDARSTWVTRKLESLEMLKKTDDPEIRILWLADKLSNARSFLRMKREGIDYSLMLNEPDMRKQKWYYDTVAGYVSGLAKYPAYQEYSSTIGELFAGVETWQP